MILQPIPYPYDKEPSEVIICGRRITDPDIARKVEIALWQLRIEKETGYVCPELAEMRRKRKQKQLKG